jgi:hypothetical protein
MTLGGEPVVEIDIKASHLTILHGLLGLPFDPSDDPYAVEGLEPLAIGRTDLRRWAVKQWTVATLGHHRHHRKWLPTHIKAFREKINDAEPGAADKLKGLGQVYPISHVRGAMVAKHPVLKDWGNLGVSWADLMFVESEAIVSTMLGLMDHHQVPSLSVHDSLIVRSKDKDIASYCLTKKYEEMCGLMPVLETQRRP